MNLALKPHPRVRLHQYIYTTDSPTQGTWTLITPRFVHLEFTQKQKTWILEFSNTGFRIPLHRHVRYTVSTRHFHVLDGLDGNLYGIHFEKGWTAEWTAGRVREVIDQQKEEEGGEGGGLVWKDVAGSDQCLLRFAKGNEESKFTIPTIHGTLQFRPVTILQVELILPAIHSELRLYPPELLNFLRLGCIALVTDLSFESQRRDGVPLFRDSCDAEDSEELVLPVSVNESCLFLDVRHGGSRHGRWVVHHEMFHLLSRRVVEEGGNGTGICDEQVVEAWKGLNEEGTEYFKGGGVGMLEVLRSCSTVQRKGEEGMFVSEYASASVEEDMAETFAAYWMAGSKPSREGSGDVKEKKKEFVVNAYVRPFMKEGSFDQRRRDNPRVHDDGEGGNRLLRQ